MLFGDVVDGSMQINEVGDIVHDEWLRSADMRPRLEIDTFVIMPNHIHGIVTIPDRDVGATCGRPLSDEPSSPTRATAGRPYGPASESIGAFIAGFKSAATRRINALRGSPGAPVWQRNYYEHIIRDEDEFERIRWYINDNPRRWAEDEYNPDRSN